MKYFSNETLNYFLQKVSPTFWILPKLYELCESGRRNSLEFLQYIYGIHFELRFFDSIWKVGPSGIRAHDLVRIVHTL